MRKSRYKLYNWLFGGLLLLQVILGFTVIKDEFVALRKFYFVDHPLLLLYQAIFVGGLITVIMLMMRENGREKGIKEMADELQVDPKDYYDHKGDKIIVTEKHSLKEKRNTYAIPDE